MIIIFVKFWALRIGGESSDARILVGLSAQHNLKRPGTFSEAKFSIEHECFY